MGLIDVDELLKYKTDHDFIDTHIVWNAPRVEAIPVSWIEEWLENMPKHTTPYFYKRFLRNAIRGMVKDWKKENENKEKK